MLLCWHQAAKMPPGEGQGALIASPGFCEGCPAQGRAVPVAVGVILEPEQGSAHRHADAAPSTLPALHCITSYVRQCWASAEPAPVPTHPGLALHPALGHKAPGSHSLGIPASSEHPGALHPAAFPQGVTAVTDPHCDPRMLILHLRTFWGTVLFHTKEHLSLFVKAAEGKKK